MIQLYYNSQDKSIDSCITYDCLDKMEYYSLQSGFGQIIYIINNLKIDIMLPNSRETNRSGPSKYRYSEDKDIFNHSFYQQRLKSEDNYSSFDYIKKYLQETNLNNTIQKMMNILLTMDKLPYNPYNLMYRLIHHEAIYQNLKRLFSSHKESQNIINYNLTASDNNQEEDLNPKDHQSLFTIMNIKDKQITISNKLSKYINVNNVYVFSKLVSSKKAQDKYNSLAQKYDFESIELSFGGPILLNLKGYDGSIDIPLKLPKQDCEKSIYCGQSMLNVSMFVRTKKEISRCLSHFIDLIIQDILQIIQYKDENYTSYFHKIEVFNLHEIFNILQFSRKHIINNAGLVNKEILKNFQKQNLIIRAKCIYRLNKDLSAIIGQEFITVYKQYILIASVQNNITIVHNSPLKFALKEVFPNQNIISTIIQQEDYINSDLFLMYKKQMVYTMNHHLKNQNLTFLAWQIFYFLLYQMKQNEESHQFLKELNNTISYILLSPLSFLYQTMHRMRCIQWLTLPSFPSFHEDQVYLLIINMERDISQFIQQGNFIYWELEIFYQSIKRLLSIIVQFKQLKRNSIMYIIDHSLLMLKGVTVNFNQILLVLKGNILSYITLLKDNFIQQKSNHDNYTSYDLFIAKRKQLPIRVLKLQEETKKVKKQLSLADSEVKLIIIAKYIKQFNLYEKIYTFYWRLFMGKKMNYPLSSFLKFLMISSTQRSFQFFKLNYVSAEQKIQMHQINQIKIYEINNPQTAHVFYSLNPAILQIQSYKEYLTVIQALRPLLQTADSNSTNLGFRYGSKTSIESKSINMNDPEHKNKSKALISIKSTQGENVGGQINSLNQCKLLIDVVLYQLFSHKNDFYTYILDYLSQVMSKLDVQNYSVLGLFSYQQNHSNLITNEDYLYAKFLTQDEILRFDYKKKMSLQKFAKFLDHTIAQNKYIEIKIIYNVRDVIKVLKLSFNFYYKSSNESKIYSLFKANYIQQRIYPSKKDLLNWCQINENTAIKNYLKINQVDHSKHLLSSLKKLHEEKEISIVQILSQRQLSQQRIDKKRNFQSQYYRQSPFYNLMQRALELIENLIILIDYFKSDRRGRYQLSHFRKIFELLRYYLEDRCLVKDDYIYSQGVSVGIINLMGYIKEYLDVHPDNSGQQRELLYLQRIATRLGNLIKFQEISCAICINESLNVHLQPLQQFATEPN